jgi:hypothetical protein
MLAVMHADQDLTRLRRRAGWALVAGLCLAAAVAIVALIAGSFDDTEARVVGTSLGFSVFSSTAAAGAALRLRAAPWAWALGTATAAVSLASFVLLAAGLWIDDGDRDELWTAFGIAGLGALWTAHASLVLRPLRPGDARPIRWLTATAIASLGIDSAVGMLALLGALDDVDSEAFGRALAVLVVIALLSTALIPLLRRLSRPAAPAGPPAPAAAAAAAFGAPPRHRAAGSLADEIAEVAERLARMPLPPEARAEVARLRALARGTGD